MLPAPAGFAPFIASRILWRSAGNVSGGDDVAPGDRPPKIVLLELLN
jgi:hypothetical protein